MDTEKLQFLCDYILAVRKGGITDSDSYLIGCAEDAWNEIQKRCRED